MQQIIQRMMNDALSTKDFFKTADMRMMQKMVAPYSGNPDIDLHRKMIAYGIGNSFV